MTTQALDQPTNPFNTDENLQVWFALDAAYNAGYIQPLSQTTHKIKHMKPQNTHNHRTSFKPFLQHASSGYKAI
jgi:hypothetical protein